MKLATPPTTPPTVDSVVAAVVAEAGTGALVKAEGSEQIKLLVQKPVVEPQVGSMVPQPLREQAAQALVDADGGLQPALHRATAPDARGTSSGTVDDAELMRGARKESEGSMAGTAKAPSGRGNLDCHRHRDFTASA